MTVYIVVITSKVDGTTKVGAVYDTMIKALAERVDLRKANAFNKVAVITRQVG